MKLTLLNEYDKSLLTLGNDIWICTSGKERFRWDGFRCKLSEHGVFLSLNRFNSVNFPNISKKHTLFHIFVEHFTNIYLIR